MRQTLEKSAKEHQPADRANRESSRSSQAMDTSVTDFSVSVSRLTSAESTIAVSHQRQPMENDKHGPSDTVKIAAAAVESMPPDITRHAAAKDQTQDPNDTDEENSYTTSSSKLRTVCTKPGDDQPRSHGPTSRKRTVAQWKEDRYKKSAIKKGKRAASDGSRSRSSTRPSQRCQSPVPLPARNLPVSESHDTWGVLILEF